jgi:two-component system, OmpR family, phosphate regulon response regulator PhoB
MAHVLVIEDERDLQKVLEFNLVQAGHDVMLSGNGTQGIELARTHRPDLVLLDLMLPDLPGTEVCRVIKREPSTRDIAVMMVTAKGEEVDRVVGLELGADDYVTKPFSIRELLLRVEAVLRRSHVAEPKQDAIEFGCLRVDRAAHRVWVGESEIELTVIERKLLVTLYDRRNRVQSRSSLLSDVWSIDADVATRTVDTHVKRLRAKLGAAGDYVQTVRGVGYRFASAPDERNPDE